MYFHVACWPCPYFQSFWLRKISEYVLYGLLITTVRFFSVVGYKTFLCVLVESSLRHCNTSGHTKQVNSIVLRTWD